MKKVIIFIDGENFRISLKQLFYGKFYYLPRKVQWYELFHSVINNNQELIRVYWYVTEFLDFIPYKFPNIEEIDKIEELLRKSHVFNKELNNLADTDEKLSYMCGKVEYMKSLRKFMHKRFEGWKVFQNGISSREKYIEFRRAGAVRFNLFSNKLEKEKGVDVKLTVDLLNFSDIYDQAIIFSGDQDYVPAISECKDRGKHIFAVNFETKKGKLLPGTAFRLKNICDDIKTIKYDEIIGFIRNF